MYSFKFIFSIFSILLVMFLLTDVLPVQAESLASPLNAIGDFLSFKPTLLIVEYTLP